MGNDDKNCAKMRHEAYLALLFKTSAIPIRAHFIFINELAGIIRFAFCFPFPHFPELPDDGTEVAIIKNQKIPA